MTDEEFRNAIYGILRGEVFKPISEGLGDPKDYSVRPAFESILGRHLPKGVTPQAARDIAKMLIEKQEESLCQNSMTPKPQVSNMQESGATLSPSAKSSFSLIRSTSDLPHCRSRKTPSM